MVAVSELLGHVTCPTGDLLLVDFGQLRLWSHDRPPVVDDGLLPPESQQHWNAARDFEVVGPDAGAVSAAIDRAWLKGRFAFDLDDGRHLAEAVTAARTARGWDAEVREVPRMPHLTRTTTLLAESPGGVEVPYAGGWAVAVRALPTDRPLEVRGERMPADGPDAERWHSVWVQVGDAEPVASETAGYVLVDEARLMFADPAALGGYLVRDSHDGLADLALWGPDAAAVAAQVGARAIDEREHGWVDLGPDDVRRHLAALDAERRRGARFAHDLRPHDDDHRLMAQARATATGSGTLELDAGVVTGFLTSWGDGAFPVHRDLAADGSTCRVRVELGAPETVARARRFERLWFGDLSLLAMVSTRISEEGAPVGWLQRRAPHEERDSGWSLYAGDETQAYLDDPAHVALVSLREVLRIDPTVEAVLEAPAPCGFERDAASPDGWRDITAELR
jgi:hypothetical protein